MTKLEADIIIKACCKHGVFSTIRREAEIYFIVFVNRIEFQDFEAAKLITNALILEKRTKINIKKSEVKPPKQESLNFSKYNIHKKKNTELGAWGKSRIRIED